jgi:adenine-specific DNA-methyltransferase
MSVTVHMSPTLNKNKSSLFIRSDEWEMYYRNSLGIVSTSGTFDVLLDSKLLPIFTKDGKNFFLIDDLYDLSTVFDYNTNVHREPVKGNSELINTPSPLYLRSDTKVVLNEKRKDVDPVYYSSLRNLIAFCKDTPQDNSISLKEIPYFGATIIMSSSNNISDFISSQIQRTEKIKQSKEKVSFFANSAYYMGSKKNLGAFLVEAISRFLSADGVIVDLMCGSGAASQAFSTIWPTFSSDAQFFCQYLARIQGSGFTKNKANYLLENLLPLARKNAEELKKYFDDWIKKEDAFFHSKIDLTLLEEYEAFIRETVCYPTPSESLQAQQLRKEVEKRKNNPTITPYCLFSTYFANIYFGLRQSVEIDSIRYAIDQLNDQNDRNWAIGALIATLSYLGSGYGGHFAQPIRPTLRRLPKLLDDRAKSAMHEFSIRLTALANESENATRTIEILPGPWQKTLLEAEKLFHGKNVLVYLDAPYKREEYSRYYHLLETAVLYNYPSATNKGRLPDKGQGKRFQSDFFTKNRLKMEAELARIICSILARGWICAWSYSDNGVANIVNVIDQVYNKEPCQVISFATPYQHKSQGKGMLHEKRRPKTVTEYCILFEPLSKLEIVAKME